MASQPELDQAYLRMALEWAKLSKAKREQVGCLIVNNNQIISDGFNGTPRGFDNRCESPNGLSKHEVLHAEANAITKLAKGNGGCSGATLYTTLSPCYGCAKLIIQAGIIRVIYSKLYQDNAALYLLAEAGVQCSGSSELLSKQSKSHLDPYDLSKHKVS